MEKGRKLHTIYHYRKIIALRSVRRMDTYDKVAVEYVLELEQLTELQSRLDFFEEQIDLSDPALLEARLQDLLHREIHSVQELKLWLKEQDLFMEQIQEILSGVYIAFHRYNDDAIIKQRYEYHQQVISPLLKKYGYQLTRKLVNSPFVEELDSQFDRLIQSKRNAERLFREENIPLEVEEAELINQYFDITGKMTVTWQGEEKTLPQMSIYLKDGDRQIRERAWRLISDELFRHEAQLNDIMSKLIRLRQQKAENAGFKNYRDYIFAMYEREYTPEDTYQFYEAVKKHVVPVVDELQRKHQRELGLADYKLWDTQAVPQGKRPLKPFDQTEQLVKGVIRIFERMDPQFAHVLREMEKNKLLDLESRKGKSPGGFCSRLPITGLSFIFMNAAGRQADLSTLVHEGGHAVQNYLTRDLPVAAYKRAPLEAAELASMTMELFSLDKWHVFYQEEEDLKRAQKEHLEEIISFLPWAMVIDQFQHWLYTHPEHTPEERNAKFRELAKELSHHYVDTEGFERELETRWLLQLHLFEVPFYYIEYAIAQLGALQMWQAYHQEADLAIRRYKRALALGGSASLKEIYETAGIRFDFSEKTVKEMVQFVKQKLEELE